MKKYLAMFRIRFINTLQYRAAALAGIATQFAWGFMEIFAFAAFYRVNPAAFPMQFEHFVSYIWIQQAFLALFMMWFWESDIAASITEGSIAYEMVRPVDLYGRWFTQITANRLARAVLRCMPILFIAFLLPAPYCLTLPPDILQLVWFLVSAALALCVVATFSMLVYISLFYTISASGTRIISSALSDFLAGAIIPLPFFPEKLRVIAELLPFAAMQNMPLRIYSGDISGMNVFYGLMLQIVWIAVLLALGRLIMHRAMKKVIVQGG